MGDVKIDTQTFAKRVHALQKCWRESAVAKEYEQLQGLGAVLVVTGNSDDEKPYRKSGALHQWLLGYEFPSTVLLLTKDRVYFVTSATKAKLIQSLKQLPDGPAVTILERTKDQSFNDKLWNQLLDVISKLEGHIGKFAKDEYEGSLVDEWAKAKSKSSAFKGKEEVDVGGAFAALMAKKDPEEIALTSTACRLSSAVISSSFIDQMTDIIDLEKKTTHEEIAEKLESVLEDRKFFKNPDFKLPDDLDVDAIEFCYTAIVQSGGKYDLKTSALSDNRRFASEGAILCSLGLRYKSYCSNVGRTYLINPTKDQEANYTFLLSLQAHVLSLLRPGVALSKVYNDTVAYVKKERPELESHFIKSMGFLTGIEFREGSFVIGPKCNRTVEAGMIFNLSLGFTELKDENGSLYALSLIDTVLISEEASKALTSSSKKLKAITFSLNEEANGDGDKAKTAPEKKKNGAASSSAAPAQTAILKSKLRNQDKDIDEGAEIRRRNHQKELAEKKQAEGLERFGDHDGGEAPAPRAVFKRFESYRREDQLPENVKDLNVHVDVRSQTIILPIYGMAVPFHVSTLKNLSKNDEGEYVYLRFNFQTPGQSGTKKEDMPFEDTSATFVRSMTFRSTDGPRFSELFRVITELKKSATKREQERKEMADVVEQDHLIEMKGRRPLRLQEVFLRPGLDGKRVPGDLELHQNGIRYQSPLRSDQKVDVPFSNVKHLFFQPCDQELIAVIHFALRDPIIIGKKKTQHVQLYREASDAQFDETGNRKRKHRYGDEDELEAEQDERRRRAALNKELKAFADKIAEQSEGRLDVDVPFRELGFAGVPFRSNVLLQPTTDALVHLIDPPFLVVTLADIEIAHLERIQFGLKNFDLVFVLRDFTKPPIHVNTIPMAQLDNVKEWLDSCDIAFTEGPVNLNWTTIMKTINDDPAAFFKEGGWEFLGEGSSEEGSEESESASEFDADSDAFDDDDDESGSSFDEDASASNDEGSASDFDDEEEGEDWDELERKTMREEEASRRDKHGRSDDVDDRRAAKKSRGKR